MRISDWSSDVCSSDLAGSQRFITVAAKLAAEKHFFLRASCARLKPVASNRRGFSSQATPEKLPSNASAQADTTRLPAARAGFPLRHQTAPRSRIARARPSIANEQAQDLRPRYQRPPDRKSVV